MKRVSMRPCELMGLMLLGLLPSNAVRTQADFMTIPTPADLAGRTAYVSPPHAAGGRALLDRLRSPAHECKRMPEAPRFADMTLPVASSFAAAPSIQSSAFQRAAPIRGSLSLKAGLSGSNGGSKGPGADLMESAKVADTRKKVLITGGAGYIGSHLAADLLAKDYDVVILDNFCNASPKSIERVQELSGKKLSVHEADTRDPNALRKVFDSEVTISSVVHLAGLKAVGESVEKPHLYYDNNVLGSINLCKVMAEYDCKNLVFSSSATVYGDARSCPIKECHALSATSPYGRSKLIIEEMLRDTCSADPDWGVVILRYFNPVGAHPSGMLGEDPKGTPNNLMPYIAKVATGKRDHLSVFGNDYDTKDGTGVRDYLHIMDLSRGHVAAIEKLEGEGFKGADAFNLGTGTGISVLEMVDAFEAASHKPIPYKFEARRKGDVAVCYADASKAERELNWRAEHSLDDMCGDLWRWIELNPDGYTPDASRVLAKKPPLAAQVALARD